METCLVTDPHVVCPADCSKCTSKNVFLVLLGGMLHDVSSRYLMSLLIVWSDVLSLTGKEWPSF